MVPVMEPSENRKPLPVLAHMPPHIKMEIGESLDYFDKIALRNLNSEFRRTIKAPKISAVVILAYRISHQCQCQLAEVIFRCDELKLRKAKDYIKNEQGWTVENKYSRGVQNKKTIVQKEGDLVEMMVQDFKSILDIPMLTIGDFRANFDKTDEIDIMPSIVNVISNLEAKMKVEYWLIASNNCEEILAILPYLDTDALQYLTTGSRYWPDGTPYSIDILELHRFPNLIDLTMRSHSDILPVESWWNIPCTWFETYGSPTDSLAQLPRIIQHFRQKSTFDECTIELNCTGSSIKEAIGSIIGQFERDLGSDYFHLPAEGSDLELYGRVNEGLITFMRANPRDDRG